MTDYLERLNGEDVDALLEEERRLAGIWPGMAVRTGEGSAAPEEGKQKVPDQTEGFARLGQSAIAVETGGSAEPPAFDWGLGMEDFLAPAQTWGLEEGRETIAPGRVDPEGGKRLPLQEGLERLDRAAAVPSLWEPEAAERGSGMGSSGEWPRDIRSRGTLSPESPNRRGLVGDMAGAVLPAGGGNSLAGTGEAWAAPADRAEQIDRIFRRDSRRYDGGFFLY